MGAKVKHLKIRCSTGGWGTTLSRATSRRDKAPEPEAQDEDPRAEDEANHNDSGVKDEDPRAEDEDPRERPLTFDTQRPHSLNSKRRLQNESSRPQS